MINLKKMVLLTSFSIATLLYANEPSVYGAGNIDSATPYGLTQTERTVLENKKTIQMLYNKINEQQRKVDGLSTIIEGQNKEIVSLKEKLEFQGKNTEKRLQHAVQDANKSYALLLELGGMIDEIKNSYVTQDTLQTNLQRLKEENTNAIATATANAMANVNRNMNYNTNSVTMEDSNLNANSYTNTEISADVNYAESYREGVQLFYQRSYQAAKERFDEVLAANYKAAPSNFYLGEIAYYTHQYGDAVAYYKQSALLYDSASYMDVLYLHTAISLDKSGDSNQAKSLYEYVISTYPGKKSASIAQNRLSQ